MTTFPNKSLLALLSCTIILPEASVFALISFDTHLFGSSSSSSSAGSTTVERSSRKRQQQYAFSPLFSQRTNNENDESDGEGEIVNGKKKGESLDHIRSRLEELFHTPPNEWVSSTADNKSSFQYKEADWLEACGEECEVSFLLAIASWLISCDINKDIHERDTSTSARLIFK